MKTIMLVDDKEISNFIMRKFIEIRIPDSKVIEFTNPVEAFQNIEESGPDVIFLDLNMPEMDGWQFLDQMKAESFTNPVAILTSSTSRLDMERAENYDNVVNFYVKPLNPEELSRIFEIIK